MTPSFKAVFDEILGTRKKEIEKRGELGGIAIFFDPVYRFLTVPGSFGCMLYHLPCVGALGFVVISLRVYLSSHATALLRLRS